MGDIPLGVGVEIIDSCSLSDAGLFVRIDDEETGSDECDGGTKPD